MSNVSIFEKRWLDLVFEGRNKEYGAYRLRLDNPKTTLGALFIGVSLFISALAVAVALNALSDQQSAAMPLIDDEQIVIAVVNPPQPPKPDQAIVPPAKKQEQKELDNNDLMNPEVVKNTEDPDNVKKNSDPPLASANNGVEGGTATSTSTSTSSSAGPTIEAPATGNALVTTAMLDKLPEYPGGINAFLRYVGDNFRKPELDEAKTIRVIVSFVIEKDGRMTEIEVLQNPGYGLDKEAIRVLKSQKTKWSPGLKNGQPVRTIYTLPIKIKVD
jgi:protein TonB